MTEVSFYHLQKWPLEKALPALLVKTLEAGRRAVVKVGSEDRIDALDTVLWTFESGSWLPHGSSRDGNPEHQPVWLTTGDDNPNDARFLFLADGQESARTGDYERCFDLFDGNDPAAVTAARERWKSGKAAGHSLRYWQQTDRGGWAEKA